MSYNEIISKKITVNELTRPLLRKGKKICKNARCYVEKARAYICRRHGVKDFLKISCCLHEIESALTLLLAYDLEESEGFTVEKIRIPEYENRGTCWNAIRNDVSVLFEKLQNVIWLDSGAAFFLLSEAERLVFKLNGLLNSISEISSTEKNEDIEEK